MVFYNNVSFRVRILMESILAFLITWTLASSVGFDSGVQHQIYYDKVMRERAGKVIYQEGYELGIRKAELDRKVKMLTLGIEFMEDTKGGEK